MFYQISQRILEAHANVQEMTLMEAKMNYIRAWQTLPEYGLTYFIIKLQGSKKEVCRMCYCSIAFCITFITALHLRSSEENSVCPSVCPSVCHTHDP